MPIYTLEEMYKIQEGRRFIIVIGPSTTGKTYSLWTLVAYLKEKSLGPLHLIDLDQKCESLLTALREEPEAQRLKLDDYVVIRRLKPKPMLVTATTPKVTGSTYLHDQFAAESNFYENQIDVNTGRWKAGFECGALFIDSLSRYNKIVTQLVIANVGHDIGAPGTEARNDYVSVMNKVEQTIDSMQMLPCIVGWIAHEQFVEDQATGQISIVANVQGKNTLAPNLPNKFNFILYSTTQPDGKDNSKYMWRLKPGGMVRTAGITSKSAKNLPTFIEQDYRKIL